MNTGTPQGSQVSPILSTIYLSGLFGHGEDKVPGIKALSFVDDVAWLAEGGHGDALSATLERAAKAAQEWADANAVTFDTQKTEAIVLNRRRRTPLQQAGNPVAGRLAGLAADTKGAPQHKDQEGQERAEQATETRGTGRPLARELPAGVSSRCPSSNPLRIATVVEGRRRPRHQKPAGGCPRGDQPRNKAHTGSLPDHDTNRFYGWVAPEPSS